MPDISELNGTAIANVAEFDALTVTEAVVGTPAAAYSVRLLDSAVGVPTYTGACMRVRRFSDNVEADVGFDTSDELSLTSPISNTSDAQSYTDFADFVDHTGTPTDAFVRYWYDQSGNAADAGQSTAGSQPKIYDSSTGIVEEGSAGNEKPGLDFRSPKLLTLSDTNPKTVFAVGSNDDAYNTGTEYFMLGGTTTAYSKISFNRTFGIDKSAVVNNAAGVLVEFGTAIDTNQKTCVRFK